MPLRAGAAPPRRAVDLADTVTAPLRIRATEFEHAMTPIDVDQSNSARTLDEDDLAFRKSRGGEIYLDVAEYMAGAEHPNSNHPIGTKGDDF